MALTRVPFLLPGQSVEAAFKEISCVVFFISPSKEKQKKFQDLLENKKNLDAHVFSDLEAIKPVLPVLNPTIICLDTALNKKDPLEPLVNLRSQPITVDLPVIFFKNADDAFDTTQAFLLGATDVLTFWPVVDEWIARLKRYTQWYSNLIVRRQLYQSLKDSEDALKKELNQAGCYAQSLVPPPLQTDDFSVDWFFQPSTYLGGDHLGYNLIKKGYWAFYVVDVAGHGVGAALFAAQIISTLHLMTLTGVDYLMPKSVLEGLNRAFPMTQHSGMYFSAFYGVLDVQKKQLSYACAGHPPAVVLRKSQENPLLLKTRGLVAGADLASTYEQKVIDLCSRDELYIFSDGVFEIFSEGGNLLGINKWIEFLKMKTPPMLSKPRYLYNHIRSESGSMELPDDFTVLEVKLK